MLQKITKSLFVFKKYTISFIILFNAHAAICVDFSSEVKSYITNIKSIAVEFEQSDSNGQVAHGMLIIDKPYKFRCNYYEPFPIVIIGNKNYVSVYDYEMENLSRIKADENIFYFLLVDNVNFDKKFEVLSSSDQGGVYSVKLRHIEMDKIAELTFDKKSKQIKQMQIFEDSNVVTLNFAKERKIHDVSRGLFIIQNPKTFGTPARFNKQELQKKFKD
jgi:outer membrane lipoprotein-sorting protein